MGLEIIITADAADAKPLDAQIDDAMSALGFVRRGSAAATRAGNVVEFPGKAPATFAELGNFTDVDQPDEKEFGAEKIAAGVVQVVLTPSQPAPGRKRRTKAEIAEDEARAATVAATAVVETPLISSGEDRTGPQVAAQDAADEARESAAGKTGELTTEDLRAAVQHFTKQHGLVRAQAEIPVILGSAIVDVKPEHLAEAIRKVQIAAGVETVMPPVSESLFDGVAAPRVWTAQDVIDAFKVYALKYDGQNTDMKAAVLTLTDGPAVLKKLFNVTNIQGIPNASASYEAAVAAVLEAVETNPFGRVPK